MQRCHDGTVRDATVAYLEMVQSLNNYRENFGRLRTSGKFAGGSSAFTGYVDEAEQTSYVLETIPASSVLFGSRPGDSSGLAFLTSCLSSSNIQK